MKPNRFQLRQIVSHSFGGIINFALLEEEEEEGKKRC